MWQKNNKGTSPFLANVTCFLRDFVANVMSGRKSPLDKSAKALNNATHLFVT
jgi:hypothetical protein